MQRPANDAPPLEEDEEYRESEDEDFNPDEVKDQEESEDSEQEEDEQENEFRPEKNEIEGHGSSEIQAERIRTRSQRTRDIRDEPIKIDTKVTVDVDELWKSMNDTSKLKTATTTTAQDSGTDAGTLTASASDKASKNLTEEYITIKRTYKFAGKVTHEEKRVLASSAEGQEYLRQQKHEKEESEVKKQSIGKRRPPPKKRKSSLLDELEAGKAKKMNTLEKSRMDWLGYVDQQGIREDLTRHNKGGYLEKQDFLSRVEHKIHSDFTDAKKKSK